MKQTGALELYCKLPSCLAAHAPSCIFARLLRETHWTSSAVPSPTAALRVWIIKAKASCPPLDHDQADATVLGHDSAPQRIAVALKLCLVQGTDHPFAFLSCHLPAPLGHQFVFPACLIKFLHHTHPSFFLLGAAIGQVHMKSTHT